MTEFGDSLTLARIQRSAISLKQQVDNHYMRSVFIFIGGYLVVNLWLPAAAILTLLAGFLFGVVWGAVYVDIAASAGAMAGFWISRYLIGDWIQQRWRRQLVWLNTQVADHGHFYLVFIRMVPMMPYALINYLAGLTKLPARTIIWTTALGSLPGIIIFCYAGQQLLMIQSVEDVLTKKVIAAMALLIVFSASIIVIRVMLMRKRKNSNRNNEST